MSANLHTLLKIKRLGYIAHLLLHKLHSYITLAGVLFYRIFCSFDFNYLYLSPHSLSVLCTKSPKQISRTWKKLLS